MKLDLRFSDRSLENLWCQAVAAFSFQAPDLELSGLDKLNLKMGGTLSDLISRGHWTGERGESFLLSSQGAIPAEKILCHGLGPAAEYNIEVLKRSIQSMGSALDKLAVNDFSIYIPLIEGFENEYTLHLECSVPVLVKSFCEVHGREKDYLLKIVCCVKQGPVPRLRPLVDRLREYFSSFLDCSIIIGYEVKENTEI